MSEPLARLYDLTLRTLDEQERRADALRGRLGPVLAAAALGVSLLSGPIVGGAHPTSIGGKLAVVVAVCGLLAAVAGVLRLLGAPRRPVDAVDPWEILRQLEQDGLLYDDAVFFEAMILRLAVHHHRRVAGLVDLASAFTAMLWGILVMLCGLAFAAIVG